MRACRGKLDFYEKKGGFFQATCGNVAQEKCALTRTARKLVSSSDGAPVGLTNSFVESREEHWSAEALRGPQQSDREAARAELKTLPGGTVLLACERVLVGDELEEPASLAGLVLWRQSHQHQKRKGRFRQREQKTSCW